jgi:hypothetical protein
LGISQHFEVLGDGRAGHVEAGRELRHGDTAASEAVQNRSARRVGDGMEDVDTCACSSHQKMVTNWLPNMRSRASGVNRWPHVLRDGIVRPLSHRHSERSEESLLSHPEAPFWDAEDSSLRSE